MTENNSIKKINIVSRPIVLLAFGLFFSCIGYGLWENNKELVVSVNIIYLLFIFFLGKRGLTILILLTQLTMVGISYNYYESTLKINEIRIVEKSFGYIIGETDSRKVALTGNTKGLALGDKIIVKGSFKKLPQKEEGIVGEINIDKYCLLKKDFVGILIEKRNEVIDKLREKIGSRKAGLVASIAYGDKSFLDKEDKDDMNRMGIIHAISVSGMHIFLIYFIFSFLLGKKLSLVSTTIYVIFTGGAISSIRALIMIILSTFSLPVKRKYDPLGALSFSAIILMIWKPYSVFNVGFLLSYSATFGIVLFSNKINTKLYKIPKFLRDGIAVSLSSQVFSLPIIMFFFKSISINFFLGNIVLIPIINIILILGNLLPLLLKLNYIFTGILFWLVKSINLLDYILDRLYNISYDSIWVNISIIKVVVATLIFIYFYIKLRRNLVFIPLVFLALFFVESYSPFLTVEYYKNGAIAIRHKGESTLITNKKNINLKELKQINKIEKAFVDEDNIEFSEYYFEKLGKDYIFRNDGERFLLKMSKEVQKDLGYDIIDFNKEKINKIILIDNKFFTLY